jgi:arylsulfatase A-like enzyme/tetratricopeptide (TPR) repeat protein
MIALLTLCLAAPAPANVVFVTIDTLRADRLGAYGYSRAQTPVLDRLAEGGVLIEEAVVQAPQTRPSHASLLTGLYPYEHGLRDNDSPPLDPKIETLATLLKARGYATAAFVGAYPVSRPAGFFRGFDVYDDPFGAGEKATTRDPRLERTAAAVVDPALAFVARQRASPWFIWLHLFDPHAPYEAPSPFKERFGQDPYDGEIAYVDAQLGRLLAGIEAAARPHSQASGGTLVVVTSDHGESLGEHGEDEHGVFVYDSTLRVPLLWSWPGRLPEGARVKGQFRSVDLLPTLLELLGLPRVTTSGASRAAELRAGRPLPDNASYAEGLYGQIHFGWAPLHSLRGEGYKLIEAPAPELYRLAEDPGETRNLIGERTGLAQGMRSHLASHLARDQSPRASPGGGPDPAAAERLAALGYVGGGGASSGPPSGADPKDRIAAYQSRRRETRRGLRAFRAGDLDGAIRILQPLSEAATPSGSEAAPERRSFNVDYFLGRSLLERGRAREALAPLEAAVLAAPASVPARVYLAQAHAATRAPGRALATLEAGLSRAPENPELLQAKGAVLLRMGDAAAAQAALETARSRDPASVALRVDLAGLYRGRGALDLAEREVAAALRLEPEDPAARVERALLVGARGDEPAAARELRAVLEDAPRHADALFYLAALDRRAGRVESAIGLLERLVQGAPGYPGGRTALEDARRARGPAGSDR